MTNKQLLVRGFVEFFEDLNARASVAATLRALRAGFRGAQFNPSLLRHAAKQVANTAPEHPLAIPSTVGNILAFLSKREASGESREWARRRARELAAMALFSRRWAKRAGVPLRKSKRFV